jgi:hypothetical protein
MFPNIEKIIMNALATVDKSMYPVVKSIRELPEATTDNNDIAELEVHWLFFFWAKPSQLRMHCNVFEYKFSRMSSLMAMYESKQSPRQLD